jgi:hypothetical protein
MRPDHFCGQTNHTIKRLDRAPVSPVNAARSAGKILDSENNILFSPRGKSELRNRGAEECNDRGLNRSGKMHGGTVVRNQADTPADQLRRLEKAQLACGTDDMVP